VDHPAEKEEQKQNQGGRGVKDMFINAKKVGKIVYQGKGENEG